MNYLEEEDQRVSEEAMGETRTFSRGDRVVAAYDQGRPGTVRDAGEQQTGVQWDDRRYFGSDVNYVPNNHLMLLGEANAAPDEAEAVPADDPGDANRDAADDLDEPTSDDVEDESGDFDDEVPEELDTAAEPGDHPPAAASPDDGQDSLGETTLAETQREQGNDPPATASDDEDWENFKNSPEEAERLKVTGQLPDAIEPGDHAPTEADHEETEATAAETHQETTPHKPIPASRRVADRDMPSMAIEDLLALYQEMGREAIAIGLGVNERKAFPTMSQAVAACIAIKRRIHIHHQEADRRASKQKEIDLKKAAKRAAAPRKVTTREQSMPKKAAAPKKTVVKEQPKKVAAAHRNGAGRPPNGESKTAAVGRLLRRKSGTTTAEVLALTGWPSVSMPAAAKACGLTLRKEKNGRIIRYYGEEA
jgi:hypothetical protein